MAMIPNTRRELVPAPAKTAGIVNTPVPMMLPITSAVAEGRPNARARSVAGEPGVGASGVVVAFVSAIAIRFTFLFEPWSGMSSTVLIIRRSHRRSTGSKVPGRHQHWSEELAIPSGALDGSSAAWVDRP